MNSRRQLIILISMPDEVVNDMFVGKLEVPEGYSMIYCHSGLNDEPPYGSCTFWRKGFFTGRVWEEEGESVSQYLIRTENVRPFIDSVNACEKDRLDGLYQYTIERNYEPENFEGVDLSKLAHAEAYYRAPKIKCYSYSTFKFD